MGADTRSRSRSRTRARPGSEGANVLISQLEGLVGNAQADSTKSGSSASASTNAGRTTGTGGASGSSGGPLPNSRQMFGIGKQMFRFDARNSPDLPMAYQHLVGSLPEPYLRKLFAAFHTALTTLLGDSHSKTKDSGLDLAEASQALCGFFSNSPLLCRIVYSTDWISSLAAVYDRLLLDKNKNADVVLSSISFLLLDGMTWTFKGGSSGVEDSLLQAIRAMEEQSTDCLGHLQRWQATHEPFRRTLQSELRRSPALAKGHDDEANLHQLREYILNMLESAEHQQQQHRPTPAVAALDNRKSTTTSQTARRDKSKPVSAADELERRIQQVKQILPEFGEGFLESALSLYQGDVEATVSTLLQDQSEYPTSLRVLDKTLPRRRKERSTEEAEESEQARQLVKERVAMEEQREQERYKALLYMAEREREARELQQQQDHQREIQDENQQLLVADHNEYDDDYDDQYDDIDVKLGGADVGMYDFEQVKMYNQAAKQEEAEASFWEQNRNTNRQPNPNTQNKHASTANDGGQGKQYRGPDKIKGGRVIGADGKVVKNSRGHGKKKPGNATNSNTTHNGSDKSNANGQNQNQNQTKVNSSAGPPAQKGKPKTAKPKSNNRINRQRDKKQKAQGVFGAQN